MTQHRPDVQSSHRLTRNLKKRSIGLILAAFLLGNSGGLWLYPYITYPAIAATGIGIVASILVLVVSMIWRE